MIKKLALICVALSLVVLVSGCCGAFTRAANDVNMKQAAYENMNSKQVIADNLTYDYNQMSEELESLDYTSDPSGVKAALNKDMVKIDGYINAITEYKASCQLYATYLDPNSDEYHQVAQNEITAGENLESAQDSKKLVGTTLEWLDQFETWKLSADKLQVQLNSSKYLSTGSDYHTWLVDTQPIVNTYLTESSTFSSETDLLIAITEPGTTRQDLLELKSTLQTGNDQIKVSYNQIVDYYNTNFGRTYGFVTEV